MTATARMMWLGILAVFFFVPANAGQTCGHRDPSFTAFLKRFKSDLEFRYSRLVLPMRFSEFDPQSAMSNVMVTHYSSMTLAQLRSTGRLRIAADPHATNSGDEGDVCEDQPKVGKNTATFVQYTCHTDIFSHTYHFVRSNGCWFLRNVEEAGE